MKKRYYTTKEVADMFGLQPRTIVSYKNKGLIKGKQRGKGYVFSQEQIDAWQSRRTGKRCNHMRKAVKDSMLTCVLCGKKYTGTHTLYTLEVCDECYTAHRGKSYEELFDVMIDNAKDDEPFYKFLILCREYMKDHTAEQLLDLLKRA